MPWPARDGVVARRGITQSQCHFTGDAAATVPWIDNYPQNRNIQGHNLLEDSIVNGYQVAKGSSKSEDGCLFDVGPTLITDKYTEYMKLVADVGLSDQLVDNATEMAVVKGNDLYVFDMRRPLRSFLTTKLLPARAKLLLMVNELRLIKPVHRTNPSASSVNVAPAPLTIAIRRAGSLRTRRGISVNDYAAALTVAWNAMASNG